MKKSNTTSESLFLATLFTDNFVSGETSEVVIGFSNDPDELINMYINDGLDCELIESEDDENIFRIWLEYSEIGAKWIDIC